MKVLLTSAKLLLVTVIAVAFKLENQELGKLYLNHLFCIRVFSLTNLNFKTTLKLQ